MDVCSVILMAMQQDSYAMTFQQTAYNLKQIIKSAPNMFATLRIKEMIAIFKLVHVGGKKEL